MPTLNVDTNLSSVDGFQQNQESDASTKFVFLDSITRDLAGINKTLQENILKLESITEDKQEQKTAPENVDVTVKPVSVGQLFSRASSYDVFFMILGGLAAAITGVSIPIVDVYYICLRKYALQ